MFFYRFRNVNVIPNAVPYSPQSGGIQWSAANGYDHLMDGYLAG